MPSPRSIAIGIVTAIYVSLAAIALAAVVHDLVAWSRRRRSAR